MNLTGTFTFNGPRDTVWALLQDPAVLAKALPGTERLALAGDDRFEGVMKVSVGPVTAAKFDVTVTLKDKVPPQHFATQRNTQIADSIYTGLFDYLDAPIVRVAQSDNPMPYAANLEAATMPSVAKIIQAVNQVTYRV